LCHATRPAVSSASATPPRAQAAAQHQWRRSLLHAFRHVHCQRACARCVVPLPPKSPAPGSRSATASVACPPPAARSCGTNRLRPSKISPCRHEAIDKGAGWKSVPSRENRNSGVSARTSRRRAARTTRHGCETYWDPAFTLGNIAHRGSK
jgi:hypothetical protein